MKNDYIQIRMNEEEKSELNDLVAVRDISISQFVREAIREKIAAMKSNDGNIPEILDSETTAAAA